MNIQVQEQSRHIVLVTIDHQPRRNAMSRPMLAELAHLWDTFERASYRCPVLRGGGDGDITSLPNQRGRRLHYPTTPRAQPPHLWRLFHVCIC